LIRNQRKLEAAGCATVMPLAAPIGSGRGIKLRHAIEIMIEQAEVPVIVDAGLGAPSQAAECMELGADGVLVNTAIGMADDPVEMARAFRLAVEAGRTAYRAGIIEESVEARPSSPITDLITS
jgi:thiazole synthase